MIYPKKISSKKIDIFLNTLILSIIFLSVALIVINMLTTPNVYWSHICILSFVYIFITVKYSLTQVNNISGYVMVQTILLAILMYFIDYRIGYRGWSLNIALPILIIVSNVTMFILTMINFKDYGKYAINQLIIVLISLSTIYFIYKGYAQNNVLINISILISMFNFIMSLILRYGDIKEEIIKKINI